MLIRIDDKDLVMPLPDMTAGLNSGDDSAGRVWAAPLHETAEIAIASGQMAVGKGCSLEAMGQHQHLPNDRGSFRPVVERHAILQLPKHLGSCVAAIDLVEAEPTG